MKIFAVAAVIIFAAVNTGRSSFQNDFWSSRPAGMAGAYTAVAEGPDALTYNAAGAVYSSETSAVFTHIMPFMGLDNVDYVMNYFSLVHPLGKMNALGVSWSGMTFTELYREDEISLCYSRDIVKDLSPYLKEYLPDLLSVGVKIKYLRNSFTLDERTENDRVFKNGTDCQTGAVDAGILAKIKTKSGLFSAGAAIENINSPDMGLYSEDRVPRRFRGGLAYERQNAGVLEKLVLSSDISYRDSENKDANLNLSGGIEGWIFDYRGALRIGANMDGFSSGFSVGSFLKDFNVRMDYAFMWPFYLKDNSGTHRFSLYLAY